MLEQLLLRLGFVKLDVLLKERLKSFELEKKLKRIEEKKSFELEKKLKRIEEKKTLGKIS